MSVDAALPFRRLARNNRLANLRLHEACLKLKPGEWEAERTSFFPSLQLTLNHILIVDWFYIDALEGGALGSAAFEQDVPCPGTAELVRAQAAADERLLALAQSLGLEAMGEEVRLLRGGGRVQVETRADVMLHLLAHDIHHRGQAHAMLSGTSVAPPQLDEFITRDDARFRASELDRLGWSEDELFR